MNVISINELSTVPCDRDTCDAAKPLTDWYFSCSRFVSTSVFIYFILFTSIQSTEREHSIKNYIFLPTKCVINNKRSYHVTARCECNRYRRGFKMENKTKLVLVLSRLPFPVKLWNLYDDEVMTWDNAFMVFNLFLSEVQNVLIQTRTRCPDFFRSTSKLN